MCSLNIYICKLPYRVKNHFGCTCPGVSLLKPDPSFWQRGGFAALPKYPAIPLRKGKESFKLKSLLSQG